MIHAALGIALLAIVVTICRPRAVRWWNGDGQGVTVRFLVMPTNPPDQPRFTSDAGLTWSGFPVDREEDVFRLTALQHTHWIPASELRRCVYHVETGPDQQTSQTDLDEFGRRLFAAGEAWTAAAPWN